MLSSILLSGTAAPYAISPLAILLDSILYSFGNPALAEEMYANEKYFANFCYFSGPPRWMFDIPLIVDPTCDQLTPNPMVITRIKVNESENGGAIEGEYAFHPYKGLYLPWMWNQKIPTSSGAEINMTDLADNTLFIRGLNKSSAHELAQDTMVNAIPGAPSLHSLTQENSKLPIPAIQILHGQPFFSRNGASILLGSMGKRNNPLDSILSPFEITNPLSFTKGLASQSEMEKSVDELLSMLSYNLKNSSVRTKSLYGDRLNAKKMFKKGVEGLAEKYDALYTKYYEIQNKAASTNGLVGVDDRPLISDASIQWRAHDPDLYVRNGYDITQSFSTSSNYLLAISCAVTEFIFTEKISSSISTNISAFSSDILRQRTDGTPIAGTSPGYDVHQLGTFPTLLGFTKDYKCMVTAINELKSALSAAGIWDKTLVYLTGDFNRAPRGDGTGSDHFGSGSGVTIFSGMIKKPILIGNCTTGNPILDHTGNTALYPGDFGHAAPMEGLNNRPISMGNVASTIAEFLDVKSPTPNDESLVRIVKGELYPISEPKNIPHKSVQGGKICKLKAS